MNPEQVNHPTHYNQGVPDDSKPALQILGYAPSAFELECIEAMRDRNAEECFIFCKLSAEKYLWRAGSKGEANTDYGKARWYLNYALGLLAKESQKVEIKRALKAIPGVLSSIER